MNIAVIGIGSNIEPEKNVRRLSQRIRESFPGARFSSLRKTEAIGPPGQPEYLNGAFLIETSLSAGGLREWLRQLEEDLGRIRTSDKYAPRTMDLDILLWNGELVDEDVRDRCFLLQAIQELIPGYEP